MGTYKPIFAATKLRERADLNAIKKVRIEPHFHEVRHGVRFFGGRRARVGAASTSPYGERLVLQESAGLIVAGEQLDVALESQHRENS